MNRTTAESPPSGTRRREDSENACRPVGEFEVVLKSGGVYCFVRRPKPVSAEDSRASIESDEARGRVPKAD